MERARKRFHGKHGITSRIFSLVLVFVMLFTMVSGLPGGQLTAQAATPTIRLYLEKPSEWTDPVFHVWDDNATVNNDGAGNSVIVQWGNQSKPKMALDSSTNLYYVDVQSSNWGGGFQFIDAGNTQAQTAPEIKTQGAALEAILAFTGDTSVYYLSDGNGGYKWYKDAQKSEELVSLGYVSPEVNGRQVTFRVKSDKYNAVEKVTVAGSMNDWDVAGTGAKGMVLTKDAGNMWSGTFTIAPGVYEYKFAPGEWNNDMPDPANPLTSGQNSKLVVPGLSDGTMDAVKKGEEATLPATLKLYKADGSSEDAAVTYALKEANTNVTLSGNKITVGSGYTGDKLELTATAGSETSTMTLTLVDKTYTYTIYYYDFDAAHMSTDATDLWIWQDGGAGGVAHEFSGTEQLLDGNTWLKATVTLPYYNKIRIIPRSKGAWDWEKDTISYNNADQAENKTIYITSTGIVSETLPSLVPPRDRFVLVEYDRPAGDYTGWNIYTWNSGFGSDVSVPVQELGGKMVAKIPVKDSSADLMLSFCMRKSETGNDWAEKDGGDHYVNVPANQTVVKAKFVQDEGIVEVLP